MGREPRRPVVLERRPDIAVGILGDTALGLRGVGHFDAVVREQGVQAAARRRRPRVVDAREAVHVARLAEVGLHQVGDLVEVAAPEGGEPLAAAVGKPLRGEGVGVDEAQAQLVVRVRVGTQRPGIDDAAHAVTVFRREPSCVDVEGGEGALVEDAGRALQQPQVKGLVQRQAVEQDQGLVGGPAADLREALQAVARRAGQAVHGFQRIFGESRQRRNVPLRQHGADVRDVGSQRVAARGDDDFVQRPGGPGRGGRPGRFHGGGAGAHDGVGPAIDATQFEAERRQDLGDDFERWPGRRFASDGRFRRNQFRGVHELESPGRGEIAQCRVDRAADVSTGGVGPGGHHGAEQPCRETHQASCPGESAPG